MSHNCFHLFRNEHHTESDYDVMRSLLLLSSIDCYVSTKDEDLLRFEKVVSSMTTCLLENVMSHTILVSDDSHEDHKFGSHKLRPDASTQDKSIDMTRARLGVDRHNLCPTFNKNREQSQPIPHLNTLENLLTPSTWDSMEQSSILSNIDQDHKRPV